MTKPEEKPPSPQLFVDVVDTYQKTAVLKAALELGVFERLADAPSTAAELATKCRASEKGMRILCDHLTAQGFLRKESGRYKLSRDSAMFLDPRSPEYMGDITEFLWSTPFIEGFKGFTEAVRKGGTVVPNEGTLAPEHPAWVSFARCMGKLIPDDIDGLAKVVDPEANKPLKILDLAAGHGRFGIGFLTRNPQATVTAVDWPNVLEVATDNARKAGVTERHKTLPGSAFDVDYGTGWDVVLLTNFIHHFDHETNVKLYKKVRDALVDGGRAATLEFVSPEGDVPSTAFFSIIMLATTPHGDAYTFKQIEAMARDAGFKRSEIHPVAEESVVISTK